MSTEKVDVEKGREIYRKGLVFEDRSLTTTYQKLFVSLRIIPKQFPDASKLDLALQILGS